MFLGYASKPGQALIDRELYLPKAWTEDRARCAAAAVPEDVPFATKPEVARRMIERALAAKVPFAWVAGDEVYGNDRRLRVWLEQNERPHVLAIKATEPLWAWVDGQGPRQLAAEGLVAGVATEAWQRLSAGPGAKGERWYDWVRGRLFRLQQPPWEHWLLARRSLAKSNEIAFYVVYGPADTPLSTLARVVGPRWTIEACFFKAEVAKQEVGLADYEVRSWYGWYRHITLAMLALAFLAGLRATLRRQPAPEATTGPAGPLLCPYPSARPNCAG